MSSINRPRLVSLDVFRGLTIALMVLVNNPGTWEHIYAPLRHASWNGCTPTDLVFPFFLFITGLSIALGKPVEIEKRKRLLFKIVKRSLILFGLGLLLNAIPEFDLANLRIPGVLQRIAIVYLICAVLYQYIGFKTQIFLSLKILITYYLLLAFIPVPGLGHPSMDQSLNLAGWVDNLLLNGHLWSVTKTWDPEGVLSTFPAIVSGLFGVLVGTVVFRSESALVRRDLMLVSWLGIIVALIWNPIFPINKNLWTSSFVLLTTGIGVNIFLLLYWMIDDKKWNVMTFFKPFQVMGSNAIVAYVLSSVMAVAFYSISLGDKTIQSSIYTSFLDIFNNPQFSSLLYALFFSTLNYLPLHIMYQKKIFVKI